MIVLIYVDTNKQVGMTRITLRSSPARKMPSALRHLRCVFSETLTIS